MAIQANPPPHEADVSKPRKLSKPRRPPTQEDAVMDPLAKALCVHRTWEDVTSGVAAQRPQAACLLQPVQEIDFLKAKPVEDGCPFPETLGAQAEQTPPAVALPNIEVESKESKSETSLAVQWLRLRLPLQEVWVQSLAGELRSHMPRGQKFKT